MLILLELLIYLATSKQLILLILLNAKLCQCNLFSDLIKMISNILLYTIIVLSTDSDKGFGDYDCSF